MNTISKIFLLFIFLLTGIFHVGCAQNKADKIDELISKYAEYGSFNGSILVADKGNIIYQKGFGFANMEWDIPNQANTKHRLASISKQFTAMLILQLVAENKLALDVSISTYLPDYPKEKGDIITVHHLLTHTSGTPNYTSFPNYRKMMRNPHRPEDLVRLFADSTLVFTPGERHDYSNSGYVLLGVIIEEITGKSYEQVLHDKIFKPLNMNNSGLDNNGSVIKNRASGYFKNGKSFVNANYIDMSVPYAAGAIYSTVEDLFLWDQALYTEQLLQKKYRDMLFDTHVSFGRMHYGYGWEIGNMQIGNTQETLKTITHGGGINGFNTLITRIPSEKSTILLLNNTSGAPLFEMTVAINGILHDQPYNFPKKSTATTLSDVIEKEGIKAALQFYQEIKDSPKYHINENEMNMLGYELMGSNSAEEAAAVFLLNLEAFPNSFNVYDSYGEAQMVLGKKAEAIENYKRSIKLNPLNENGLRMLEKLGVNTEGLIVKVPIEHLQLLKGEYVATDHPKDNPGSWKINFELENGTLFANDRGYQYKVVPLGDDKFVNPDDGASLVFDTHDKDAITFVLFGKYTFKKVK